ncbi:MAG TPA: hypothetical protein ENI61_00655 [Ignavibacteria bacterium]|nr:hypothetical protein [Ignavibacteria bacterium]
MKINVKTTVGKVKYDFEIEDQKEMETLHKAIVLGNPPKYCHICENAENDHFVLDSNKDKEGNIYVKVTCTHKGCFATASLGQYKAGGYFWKKFEERYNKAGGSASSDPLAD